MQPIIFFFKATISSLNKFTLFFSLRLCCFDKGQIYLRTFYTSFTRSQQIRPHLHEKSSAGRPGSVIVAESSLVSKEIRSESSVPRWGLLFQLQRLEVMGVRHHQWGCSLQRHLSSWWYYHTSAKHTLGRSECRTRHVLAVTAGVFMLGREEMLITDYVFQCFDG